MPRNAKNATLDALRARIRALEFGASGSGGGGKVEAVPLGLPEIDAALPWGGLPRGALHEIVGAGPGGSGPGGSGPGIESGVSGPGIADWGAAEGFAAALLARFIEGRGPALWCLARGDLFGPGLGAFGLAPDRLIVARARNPHDVPWAMEEGLRSGVPGAVLGEPRRLGLAAGRRLQLAARAAGVACLVLRQSGMEESGASAAVTRWRVAAAPGAPQDGLPADGPPSSLPGGLPGGLPGLGVPRWRVGLVRCRGGTPGEWLMEWNDETGDFAVVPLLGEREACPAQAAYRRTA